MIWRIIVVATTRVAIGSQRRNVLLSVRVKFVLVGVLLLLALGITIIAAVATIQAIQGFQQQNSLVKADDVRTVRDWMTIPYIARMYHVPENYLYQSLHITDAQKPVHDTLRLIAARYHRTVTGVIQNVQAAIQAYRSQHPPAKRTSGSTVEPMIGVGPGYTQGDTGDLSRIVMGGRTPARGHPAPPITPIPTMLRSPFRPYRVGTGEEWWSGVAPCGRPSSFIKRASFLCDRYCPSPLKGGVVL